MKNILSFLLFLSFAAAQDPFILQEHYTKNEYRIPMRDGVTLFTAVYAPKDTTQSYPIMFIRTPYSIAPYGEAFRANLGPSDLLAKERYIFVYQDVRGMFMSQGDFLDVRPYIKKKKSKNDIDESSDVYDTIEWLLKNIPRNNGNVGMWGISYPGFYAAMGLIDAHPALKAVSPQAPIGDWFIGDDFHHNGAFMLIDGFNFFTSFGKPHKNRTTWIPGFQHTNPDGYRFFLEAGSIATLKERYYGDTMRFWNDAFAHPDYDEFWKARNVPQHMKNITPAVLTVGGWFDAEDLYGPLTIYQAIEKNNPSTHSMMVLGPWFHGGWARSDGDRLGNVSFTQKTSIFYLEQIELPFFNYYLKGKGSLNLSEVYAFETGANEWRTYDTWPPKSAVKRKIFLRENNRLSFESPSGKKGYDEYISDPHRPVPYIDRISNSRGREYLTDDQRFAWQRPDVLSYETEILTEDISVAGPITANLFVTVTGTDADFIVKIIDVFPDTTPDDSLNAKHIKMGGYQMLVRGDVMRARYRQSYEKPSAMNPKRVEEVVVPLQDFHHTFKKGHKMMVQIQSTWFPLVDRNPQQFINIFKAKDTDFIKATHRILRSAAYPSNIELGIMKK